MKPFKPTLIVFTFISAFIFCGHAWSAIEGTYTEVETSTDRDVNGVVLNGAGDVHRDIPDNRNIYQIGTTNVRKAEEKDRYVQRTMGEIKKQVEDKLNQFEARIDVMEQTVHQLQSDVKYILSQRRPVKQVPKPVPTQGA